jgi:hypothetical protein
LIVCPFLHCAQARSSKLKPVPINIVATNLTRLLIYDDDSDHRDTDDGVDDSDDIWFG